MISSRASRNFFSGNKKRCYADMVIQRGNQGGTKDICRPVRGTAAPVIRHRKATSCVLDTVLVARTIRRARGAGAVGADRLASRGGPCACHLPGRLRRSPGNPAERYVKPSGRLLPATLLESGRRSIRLSTAKANISSPKLTKKFLPVAPSTQNKRGRT